MNVSRRDWLVATGASVAVVLNTLPATALHAQEGEAKEDAKGAASAPGELNDESLGKLLEALGLKPKKTETRYDFTFASKQQDQEWTLSMSAVLSQDRKTIWIMAWLDELPRSARDVPRTALLGLLAENDKMGKGKFFSYIPTNRRFVLQQVVENQGMTSGKFRGILVDLGGTVSLTYPQWTVSNWKENPVPTGAEDGEGAPQKTAGGPAPQKGPITEKEKPAPVRTAVGNAKERK